GPFTAEARLVRGGRRIVTYDVDVRDADGTLLVHAVTQGMKTDRPFKVVK
ncbi:MAG: PaaI family thioesterase, partial [Desulfovibrio sp.]|nr:PaaI family thioesterase [Desulfovibrio sp.]